MKKVVTKISRSDQIFYLELHLQLWRLEEVYCEGEKYI